MKFSPDSDALNSMLVVIITSVAIFQWENLDLIFFYSDKMISNFLASLAFEDSSTFVSWFDYFDFQHYSVDMLLDLNALFKAILLLWGKYE